MHDKFEEGGSFCSLPPPSMSSSEKVKVNITVLLESLFKSLFLLTRDSNTSFFSVNISKFLRRFILKTICNGCYSTHSYSCSNLAKLGWKKIIFLRKRYGWFLQNLFFFQKKLFVQNKYLYPLSKNSILLKKIHSVKNSIL